ncbi:MAG TPA: AbrB/MazE/SpoVT family DNA-binding domain-containing protein [Thermoanaerobaculia bacterium]|jgi:antitoxin VapB|nr:AbrB/MazE/SpoVT family DNA-binding domain-containing protein [Thermoanaerobaculia bacterium]
MSIPREFGDLPDDEVVLSREGDRLIVEPISRKRNSLSELLASLPAAGECLPEIDDPPVEPEEIL